MGDVEFGKSCVHIIAWLGPCIGKAAFEVGEEVKFAFEKKSENFSSAFSVSPKNQVSISNKHKVKYLANLAMIAKMQLETLGVNQLHHLNHCTYSDEQQYFSYRRDNVTGRMASIICRFLLLCLIKRSKLISNQTFYFLSLKTLSYILIYRV